MADNNDESVTIDERTRRLARLIYDGLEKDGWGNIDPAFFGIIADSDNTPINAENVGEEDLSSVISLAKILQQAAGERS